MTAVPQYLKAKEKAISKPTIALSRELWALIGSKGRKQIEQSRTVVFEPNEKNIADAVEYGDTPYAWFADQPPFVRALSAAVSDALRSPAMEAILIEAHKKTDPLLKAVYAIEEEAINKLWAMGIPLSTAQDHVTEDLFNH